MFKYNVSYLLLMKWDIKIGNHEKCCRNKVSFKWKSTPSWGEGP